MNVFAKDSSKYTVTACKWYNVIKPIKVSTLTYHFTVSLRRDVSLSSAGVGGLRKLLLSLLCPAVYLYSQHSLDILDIIVMAKRK